MTKSSLEYLGFVRYSGKLVEGGYFDARKSAQALIAFDSGVRYFVAQQDAELRDADYELPVRVQRGSWEALIPQNIEQWLSLENALKVAGGAYAIKAAQKMAENDFKDIGVRAVFRKSLQALQWTMKIAKHTGDIAIRTFHHTTFRDDNSLIGIRNAQGEHLFVPRQFLNLYVEAPRNLLSGLVELVADERMLEIGVTSDSGIEVEVVTSKDKKSFIEAEEETDEVLFPELIHGQDVALEGEITRGNENTNTLGVRFQEHILTAFPQTGSIVRWKSRLFRRCRVEGTIDRADEFGRPIARKPKIRFRRITPLESENRELFDEEEGA